MKTLTFASALIATICLSASLQATTLTMENIEARIALGSATDSQGFAGFFENGFTQGAVSHTDTLSFDDGVVKADFNITVEGFDETTAAAGLRTTTSAVGVDGTGDTGAEVTRIDTGESIKVTFNSVSFSVIGAPPTGIVDVGSFEALLSSIRFAAFDDGVDTYTYAGIGAGALTGDDTDNIKFVPTQTISNGDMFTVTADSGLFRGLYISAAATYDTIVPEPATFSLMAISLLGLAASCRKR